MSINHHPAGTSVSTTYSTHSDTQNTHTRTHTHTHTHRIHTHTHAHVHTHAHAHTRTVHISLYKCEKGSECFKCGLGENMIKADGDHYEN